MPAAPFSAAIRSDRRLPPQLTVRNSSASSHITQSALCQPGLLWASRATLSWAERSGGGLWRMWSTQPICARRSSIRSQPSLQSFDQTRTRSNPNSRCHATHSRRSGPSSLMAVIRQVPATVWLRSGAGMAAPGFFGTTLADLNKAAMRMRKDFAGWGGQGTVTATLVFILTGRAWQGDGSCLFRLNFGAAFLGTPVCCLPIPMAPDRVRADRCRQFQAAL